MADLDIIRGGGNDVISNFRREMDRLFSQFMGAGFPTGFLPSFGRQISEGEGGRERVIAPPTDILEEETAYRIVMEIPGIDPQNVEVNVAGRLLTLRAQQHAEQQQRDRTYHITERSYGTIQRQFRIPEDVDVNQIKAEFRNGLLALTLPKSQQAQQQRRRIEITSS